MATPKRLLLLGGYGNTGRCLADMLLRETNASLVIAGRSDLRAHALAHTCKLQYSADRVCARRLDAADGEALHEAFAEVDMVVVAASTMAYVETVLDAALAANIDYLDIQLSSHAKHDALKARRSQMEAQGRTFITDGGFHPGVPAALIREAALHLEHLEVANVASLIRTNWNDIQVSEATQTEFIEELRDHNPSIWQHGQWTRRKLHNLPEFDFGVPFGAFDCVPMFLEELRTLPDVIPTLKEIGFYVAGFDPVTDYVVMPTAMVAFKLFGDKAAEPMSHLLDWSLHHFSKPPYGVVLKLEALGLDHGHPVERTTWLRHKDAYVMTAAPVASCLMAYLEGTLPTGLHTQAAVVDPERFLRDLQHLGIDIAIAESVVPELNTV